MKISSFGKRKSGQYYPKGFPTPRTMIHTQGSVRALSGVSMSQFKKLRRKNNWVREGDYVEITRGGLFTGKRGKVTEIEGYVDNDRKLYTVVLPYGHEVSRDQDSLHWQLPLD